MLEGLIGAGLGGLAGQAADALGEPRRILMRTLGLPEQGSAMLEALGADPNSMLTRLGGVGVEMATDPLSYIGFLGGALRPLFRGAQTADRLGDVRNLERAAEAASVANEAQGLRFGSESLGKLGRGVTEADVVAAGPRVGLYNKNPGRPRTGIEAGSTVTEGVGVTSASGKGKKAIDTARKAKMAENVTANDQLMLDALASYNDAYQGGFALPGSLMSPLNPNRANMLARMNPADALTGIRPMRAGLTGRMAAEEALTPLELAMIGGTGVGALAGGIYGGLGQ